MMMFEGMGSSFLQVLVILAVHMARYPGLTLDDVCWCQAG